MRHTSLAILLSTLAFVSPAAESREQEAQQEAKTGATERFAILGTCPDDGTGPMLMAAIVRDFASIDNAPEEKERGITINTSHIEYRTVQCQAHADFLTDVVTGASRPDTAIALITARGGIDGTIDLIRFAAAAGIPRIVIFADEVDVTAGDQKALGAALKGSGFDGDRTPIIRGSALGALTGREGAAKAISILVSLTHGTAPPPADLKSPFLMPVDDVLGGPAGETVATGRIETGVVSIGDSVEVSGDGQRLKGTVTGIEMFRKLLDRGEAGDNVSVALAGVDRRDVTRGMVIAKPGSVTPHSSFRGQVYILKKEEGGRHTPFHNKVAMTAMVYTAEVEASVQFEIKGEPKPGDSVPVVVRLIVPVAMDKDVRFAIREGGRTVGAGQVTEIIK